MENLNNYELPNQNGTVEIQNHSDIAKTENFRIRNYVSMSKEILTRSEIANRCDELLSNPSPITVFKKSHNGEVYCELEDGTYYTIPVDCTLQLYFDKISMHPEVDVDFGKVKNTVEVLPYQNRIVYRQAMTGKVLKSIDIESNMQLPNQENIDPKLNPAILALLNDDEKAQNDYIDGDCDKLNIVYNFEAKTGSLSKNRSNKHIAKEMNKYYMSEQKYARELDLDHEMSSKLGYVGIIDEIHSKATKKGSSILNNKKTNNSFETNRKNFVNGLQNGVTPPNAYNSNYDNSTVSKNRYSQGLYIDM